MKHLILLLIGTLGTAYLGAQVTLGIEFPVKEEITEVIDQGVIKILLFKKGHFCMVDKNIGNKVIPGMEVTLNIDSEANTFLILPKDETRYAVMQYISSASTQIYEASEEQKAKLDEAKKYKDQRLVLNEEVAEMGGDFNPVASMFQEKLDYNGGSFYDYALRHKLRKFDTAKEYNKVRNGAKERSEKEGAFDLSIYSAYESLVGIEDPEEAARELAKIDARVEEFNKVLKREIGLSMMTLTKPAEMMEYKWQDVQNALPQNAASIEFVKVRFYENAWGENYHYYGVVLRQEYSEPKLVHLGIAGDLEPLLSKMNDRNGAIYYDRGNSDPENSPAAQLYNFCWASLEPFLEEVQDVYFSPAGVLGRVAFDALNQPNGKPIMITKRLHQIGSTRDLLEERSLANWLPPSSGCWLLAGGIEYNIAPLSSNDATVDVCDIKFEEPYLEKKPFDPSEKIKPLPGTITEVKTIGSFLQKIGVSHRILSGREANEETFRLLGRDTKSPTVIHIATHGFSHFSKNKSGEKVADKSLEKSGVYLSGTQYNYENNELKFDGRWTTNELSEQNLTNTKLVVLSACNSGKGLTALREGVYGIQRGLKLAGVQNLIVALWPVDDGAAAYFMTSFYERWLSGVSIHEAFTRTKVGMMKNSRYSSPHDWAVFQLIE